MWEQGRPRFITILFRNLDEEKLQCIKASQMTQCKKVKINSQARHQCHCCLQPLVGPMVLSRRNSGTSLNAHQPQGQAGSGPSSLTRISQLGKQTPRKSLLLHISEESSPSDVLSPASLALRALFLNLLSCA